MTMLTVISTKEGIVLSADSCANDGAFIQDKIFSRFDRYGITSDKIGFMTYQNALGFSNFALKYGYPTNESTERIQRILSSSPKQYGVPYQNITITYPPINTPIDFLKHMINNGIFSGMVHNDYTGVVVAGYDKDIPKLYTFRMGDNKRKYKPNGSDDDMYINHSKPDVSNQPTYTNHTKPDEKNLTWKKSTITLDFEKPNSTKTIQVDCFEGYFAISFAMVGSKAIQTHLDCSTMTLDEALISSRALIADTVKEMKQNDEKGVDLPIDSLVIPLEDSKSWIRSPKPIYNKINYTIDYTALDI